MLNCLFLQKFEVNGESTAKLLGFILFFFIFFSLETLPPWFGVFALHLFYGFICCHFSISCYICNAVKTICNAVSIVEYKY